MMSEPGATRSVSRSGADVAGHVEVGEGGSLIDEQIRWLWCRLAIRSPCAVAPFLGDIDLLLLMRSSQGSVASRSSGDVMAVNEAVRVIEAMASTLKSTGDRLATGHRRRGGARAVALGGLQSPDPLEAAHACGPGRSGRAEVSNPNWDDDGMSAGDKLDSFAAQPGWERCWSDRGVLSKTTNAGSPTPRSKRPSRWRRARAPWSDLDGARTMATGPARRHNRGRHAR